MSFRVLPLPTPLVDAARRTRRSPLIHRLGEADPVQALESLLADPAVAFVALQNAEAGCYIARVERA